MALGVRILAGSFTGATGSDATPTSDAPPVTFTTAYDWFLRLLLTAFLLVALYDRVQLHFAAKRVVDEIKTTERR